MIERRSGRPEQAEEEARRWIARMASMEMSASELAAFKEWRARDPVNNHAFEEQRALWRAASDRPAASRGPAARRGTARPHRHGHPHRRKIRFPRPAAAAPIAASLVAALLLSPDLLLMARADHRAGIAVEHVALPDGSRAMLDAGAAIAIAYSGGERRIDLLRGDAWFEVADGDTRPFRVAALGGVTQDVGTAFEVRREESAVAIGVTEGIVDVRAPTDGGRALRLHASQRARYERDGAVERLASSPPDSIAAWRQGEILFDRTGIADAVDRIRRYRRAPVYILGQPDAARRISGVFRVDQPDEAIDAIARVGGLSVRRFGGIVVLRPGG